MAKEKRLRQVASAVGFGWQVTYSIGAATAVKLNTRLLNLQWVEITPPVNTKLLPQPSVAKSSTCLYLINYYITDPVAYPNLAAEPNNHNAGRQRPCQSINLSRRQLRTMQVLNSLPEIAGDVVK